MKCICSTGLCYDNMKSEMTELEEASTLLENTQKQDIECGSNDKKWGFELAKLYQLAVKFYKGIF